MQEKQVKDANIWEKEKDSYVTSELSAVCIRMEGVDEIVRKSGRIYYHEIRDRISKILLKIYRNVYLMDYDLFFVILDDVSDPVLLRMETEFLRQVALAQEDYGRHLLIRVSIGYAKGEGGENADEILKRAELKLYEDGLKPFCADEEVFLAREILNKKLKEKEEKSMSEFIKEWGPAIIAAAVFVVLIMIVQSDSVSALILEGLKNIISGFSEQVVLT